MDYRVSKLFLCLVLASAAVPAGTLCAQSQIAPSDAAMAAAMQALAGAEAVRARDLAPDDFRNAEQALGEAGALQARRKHKDAARAAVRAGLYADLAAAKARYIQAKEAVEAQISANAALRRELLLGGDGTQ